jgi:hypothetical protein
LSSTWNTAARRAGVPAPIEASIAVTHVPIFAPSAIAIAVSRSTSPWLASTITMPIVAEDDWTRAVKPAPSASAASGPTSSLEERQHLRLVPQRGDRAPHQVHAEEDHPEAEQRPAGLPGGPLHLREPQGEPDGDHQHREAGHVERHDLRRDGGSEVRSRDDPDRLGQRHHAGRHEPDGQHGRHRGGLDHRGDPGAGECAEPRALRHPGEPVGQARPGRGLHGLGQLLEAEQEDRDTAEQAGRQVEPGQVRHVGLLGVACLQVTTW